MSTETPSSLLRPSGADEINRLHSEAAKLSAESRDALDATLLAAWKAGQLLTVEKHHIRRTMGPGAWQLWLEQHFSGTTRTAQRYMLLAKNVSDASFLRGMSLRQVYFRMGIATEPKSPARNEVLRQLPRHTTLAARLLGLIKQGLMICLRSCGRHTAKICGRSMSVYVRYSNDSCAAEPCSHLLQAGLDCSPARTQLIEQVEKGTIVVWMLQMTNLMRNDVFDTN